MPGPTPESPVAITVTITTITTVDSATGDAVSRDAMILPIGARSDTRRRGWTDMMPAVSRKTLVVVAAAAATTLFLLAASNRADWSAYTSHKADPHEPRPASNAAPGPDGTGPEMTVVRVDIPVQPTATDDNPAHDIPSVTAIPAATATPNSEPPLAGKPVNPYAYGDVCDAFRVPGLNSDNILLIMKTGASEAFARVPTQLMTLLRCLPNFLIFSDMEQDVAGYHIMDSLANVTPSVMEGNSDFDLYRRQKACLIDIASCNKVGDPASEGWQLDKYKNVHMAEKTYQMKPGFDWYVFVDADTYVMWPSMIQWLATMNPNHKRYLGSVSMLGDAPFAHGGSGYVVSQGAMKELVTKNPDIGAMYDQRAYQECCGDYVFSMALKEKAGVEVEQVVSLSGSPARRGRSRPICTPSRGTYCWGARIPNPRRGSWNNFSDFVCVPVSDDQRRQAHDDAFWRLELVPRRLDAAPHQQRGD